MICLNCKKQIPDDSLSCPFCGQEVNLEHQIINEIKFRRYQRWAFYAIISLVFIGMLVTILKIYNNNTKLLKDIANVRGDLEKRETELANVKTDLEARNTELTVSKAELEKSKNNLEQKMSELKKTIDEKTKLEKNIGDVEKQKEELEAQKKELITSHLGVYDTILKLSVPLEEVDFYKIAIAEYNFGGEDTDGDGLSDIIEESLGTDVFKIDTDGDGYSDKAEVVNSYNPRGEGKQAIDAKFTGEMKGKILLQVQNNNSVWYVNPKDGKRYFLGVFSEKFFDQYKTISKKSTSQATSTATSTISNK